MGVLWEKEGVVYVQSVSAKLTHSDNSPDRDAVLDAVLRNVDVASNLQGTVLGGPGITIKNYIRYTDSTYIHGAPEPELYSEAMLTGAKVGGPLDMEFLAIAPIKVNGEYVNREDNTDSDEYKTTKSLLKKVGIRFNDLSNRIQDNPDDASVDDSFFMFSMDAYTTIEPSIEYLQKFFARMAEISPIDQNAFEASKLPPGTGPNPDPLRNVLRINEAEFSTIIAYDYCTTETVPGFLPEGVKALSVFEFNGYEDIVFENAEGSETDTYRIFNTVVTYKVFNEEDQTVSSSSVYGLSHEEGITAGGTFTRTTQKHLLEEFVGLESTDLKGGTSGIHMPIATEFIKELTPLRRAHALTDGMMVLIYSATVVELEWYQQGIVKAIIIVIASWVAGLAVGRFAAALSSAVAAKGGVTIGLILTTIAQIVGANFIIDLILKKVDGPLRILLAIAALAAIQRIPGGLFSISTATMPTADLLLELATEAVYAGNADVKREMRDLQEKYETYEEEVDLMLQELKDMEEPEIDRQLALIVAQSTYENYNVSPESYFDLALMSSESIQMSYDIVQDYVKNNLELPEPNYNPLYES